MHAARLRRLLNIYPPYLGAGVRVAYVADDFREAIVELRARFYNRNYVGTHFGGSLYSMVDPLYMLMLIQILGRDYVVWDKSARIEFVRPGRGTVTARFLIEDEQLEHIHQATAGGEKYLPTWTVEVRDAADEVVARVEKTLYIKRKRPASGDG